jgi:glutamate-1-semialdehyde aminotransferase
MAEARGARVTDVDGNEYVDFCLGETGDMTGHSPAGSLPAILRQLERGLTTMLPTEDAAWVGEELTRRFGPARWQFTTSATDANRFVLRFCRQLTRRPRILVFDYCHHGSSVLTGEAVRRDRAARGAVHHAYCGLPRSRRRTGRGSIAWQRWREKAEAEAMKGFA